jgi:hypothetical protein
VVVIVRGWFFLSIIQRYEALLRIQEKNTDVKVIFNPKGKVALDWHGLVKSKVYSIKFEVFC